MYDTYYISTPAYNGLISLAEKSGFIGYLYKNKIGISEFLNRLSFSSFIDNRSPFLVQKHTKELKRGRRPKWYIEGELRLARCVTLTDEAILNYTQAALEIGVQPKTPPIMGIKGFYNPKVIVGMMLEAIGNEYVVPTMLPRAQADEKGKTRKIPETSKSKRIDTITQDNPYFPYVRRTRSGRL